MQRQCLDSPAYPTDCLGVPFLYPGVAPQDGEVYYEPNPAYCVMTQFFPSTLSCFHLSVSLSLFLSPSLCMHACVRKPRVMPAYTCRVGLWDFVMHVRNKSSQNWRFAYYRLFVARQVGTLVPSPDSGCLRQQSIPALPCFSIQGRLSCCYYPYRTKANATVN